MCEQIRQRGDEPGYFRRTRWNPAKTFPAEYERSPHVPPGTRPLVMHRLGDGSEQTGCLFWGYKPSWYKRGPVSNARLDTVLKDSPFRRPLLTWRVIVPCEGWYEWTGEKM